MVDGITNLSAQAATPQRLLSLYRSHWAIENRLHYCRDVCFHEDDCQLAIGHTPPSIAVLNNLVLELLRLRSFSAITSARRFFDAFPLHALALILFAVP